MRKRNEKKNICKHCGGPLVIEYLGSYGSVYALKENGEPAKRRLRKIFYEENNGSPLIYCMHCGKEV